MSVKRYSDQELVSNVYRAGTSGCEIGSDFVWSVSVLSPKDSPVQVSVHAANVSTAKRIARQYAERVLHVAAPSAPLAERLN